MLSYQTIEPHTLELLRQLSKDPLFSTLRLVGGTALALQYGHRNSIDLDFFGQCEKETDEIETVLEKYGNVHKIKGDRNINIFTIDGVKVDIVNYCYPWIDEPVIEDELILASPIDIAAMKINAIEGRGTKKDFIDVYELLQHFSLKEIMNFHSKKYKNSSEFRAIMSLSYFEDAEIQPMPKMFCDVKWDDMKAYIKHCIAEY